MKKAYFTFSKTDDNMKNETGKFVDKHNSEYFLI